MCPVLTDKDISTMLCHRCLKSLRSCEGIRCGMCESGFHLQCVGTSAKCLELERGDRGLQWVCATCQHPTSDTKLDLSNPKTLHAAINAITEKFELVNKIQLPKLNNDLMQLKSVTEQIVKQNDDILLKIDELKNRRRSDQTKCITTSQYRKRNVNLSPRVTMGDEQTPSLGTDKLVGYRTRRRSYPLLKMLLQLNRRLRRTSRR